MPKKKKNKQTKTVDTVSAGVAQSASENDNLVNGSEENHQRIVSKTEDVQNEGVQKMNVDLELDRDRIDGTESSILVEAEKVYWLDREASLERKIKELQQELDVHKQKEVDVEANISQLQTEKDSWFQKEADLQKNISQLHSEKVSLLQKEADCEGKIEQLVDEVAILNSKGVSVEEKIKQMEQEKVSWVQEEKSIKETIASLNRNNTRLQAQVVELEASRSDLFHQNQQLKENISGLQSQIAIHSSTGSTMHGYETEDMKSQLEAAQALVEKLLSENAELIGKVNYLYDELDRRSVTAEASLSLGSDPKLGSSDTPSSALESDPMPTTIERPESVHVAGPIFESSDRTLSTERVETSEDDVIESYKAVRHYMNAENSDIVPNSRVSIGSEEIVQIPLDENEVKVMELEAGSDGEKANVPITDAPLIGAPFRLLSFVARYVSGADLVNKSASER